MREKFKVLIKAEESGKCLADIEILVHQAKIFNKTVDRFIT